MSSQRNSIPFLASLLIIVAMVLFCIIVVELATMLCLNLMGDVSMRTMTLLIQTSQVVAMVVGAVLAAKVLRENLREAFLVHQPRSCCSIVTVALVMMLFIPVMNYMESCGEMFHLPEFLSAIENALREMEERAAEMFDAMMTTSSIGGLIINLLVIALGAAVSEECIFRGVLLHLFRNKWGVHVSVWLSAIIFSLIHFQIYGFIPRMLVGALFGYFAVWSGSLLLPIVAHFTNNACVVLASYFLGEQADTIFYEPFVGEHWWLMALCTIAGVLLLVVVKRQNTRGVVR
ncbi:MAG: CPBP family intramembrane metalloprotease [Bacteroidales bacterium]|nr:CPBP family intramembrane metalloprotease [Bacteroidales bacterium]